MNFQEELNKIIDNKLSDYLVLEIIEEAKKLKLNIDKYIARIILDHSLDNSSDYVLPASTMLRSFFFNEETMKKIDVLKILEDSIIEKCSSNYILNYIIEKVIEQIECKFEMLIPKYIIYILLFHLGYNIFDFNEDRNDVVNEVIDSILIMIADKFIDPKYNKNLENQTDLEIALHNYLKINYNVEEIEQIPNSEFVNLENEEMEIIKGIISEGETLTLNITYKIAYLIYLDISKFIVDKHNYYKYISSFIKLYNSNVLNYYYNLELDGDILIRKIVNVCREKFGLFITNDKAFQILIKSNMTKNDNPDTESICTAIKKVLINK